MSLILTVTPGPDSLLALRSSLLAGRRAGARVAAGATRQRRRHQCGTCIEYRVLPDWEGTHPAFAITPVDDGASELRFRHYGLTPELDCIEVCREARGCRMTPKGSDAPGSFVI